MTCALRKRRSSARDAGRSLQNERRGRDQPCPRENADQGSPLQRRQGRPRRMLLRRHDGRLRRGRVLSLARRSSDGAFR